jgi:hypothetical protein
MESLSAALRGHRPLLICTLGSLGLTVLALGGLLLDDRMLTGAPIWLKPLKFGVSTAIYAVTLAWLMKYVTRGRRLARAAATVFSVMMLGELVAITTQVIRGTTSHFNYQTTADGLIWRAMAVMIVAAWLCNVVLAVALLRQRLTDRPLATALRAGIGIALVGMAVAFFMTTPPLGVAPTTNDGGIVGAHSVGVPDGGPGLPLVGWSTEGGDLRVAHFIGIHALQAIPLITLGLSLLAGRSRRLASERVRVRLVRVLSLGYLGLVILTAWQAIRGQSIIAPDATTTLASAIAVAAVAGGVAEALTTPATPRTQSTGSVSCQTDFPVPDASCCRTRRRHSPVSSWRTVFQEPWTGFCRHLPRRLLARALPR